MTQNHWVSSACTFSAHNNCYHVHKSDEDDLFDIIDEIVPSLNSKYYEIGLGLRLKSCALKDIKSSCQTPNIILTEVITAWLNKKYNVARFGPPTWQWLVRVVDSKAGGNDHDLAKKIASKHPARKSGLYRTLGMHTKTQIACFVACLNYFRDTRSSKRRCKKSRTMSW